MTMSELIYMTLQMDKNNNSIDENSNYDVRRGKYMASVLTFKSYHHMDKRT